MRSIFTLASFLLILWLPAVHANSTWVQGGVAVLEASGGLKLEVPSTGEVYESFDDTTYLPGLLSCQAESDASILLHTSSRMTLQFRGEGFFSVERFEGTFGVDPDAPDELIETQSRFILTQRMGELFIDSRSLSADSKFVVETPFGRISSLKAVLQVRIEYDYRSGIYDFTISCAEGTVRLRDLSKQVYTIYAGQRISGAGSYVEPSIEVAQQTQQIREKFDRFLGVLAGLESAKIDWVEMRAHKESLPDVMPDPYSSLTASGGSPAAKKRPRVIEFAPQADAITPFRGEVKPPSDSQADIF